MDKSKIPPLTDPIAPKLSIRGIFFDLNGTLFISSNNEKAWDSWFSTLFESFVSLSLLLSSTEFSAMCDGFFDPSFSFTVT
ncbi:MAG: hypothetical protein ACTSYI_09235 [Promethearchaeota archaeon]